MDSLAPTFARFYTITKILRYAQYDRMCKKLSLLIDKREYPKGKGDKFLQVCIYDDKIINSSDSLSVGRLSFALQKE